MQSPYDFFGSAALGKEYEDYPNAPPHTQLPLYYNQPMPGFFQRPPGYSQNNYYLQSGIYSQAFSGSQPGFSLSNEYLEDSETNPQPFK
jgi:hypothetical protein